MYSLYDFVRVDGWFTGYISQVASDGYYITNSIGFTILAKANQLRFLC
jgi:hypothetical protein